MFRSISVVKTPPFVSMPSESGVTSSRRTSLTSPLSTPAWMAAPTATTSSGLTPLCGSLPIELLDLLLHGGHAGHAADEDDVVDLRRRRGRRPRAPASSGRPSARAGRAVSSFSFARVSCRSRCFGPSGVAVTNGRLICVVIVEESSIFAFSAASYRRWSAILSGARSMPWSLLELGDHPVDDRLVEVVAAEVVVAVRRLHLEDALAELEHRHVERAAAEVEDEDRLVGASLSSP